MNGLDSPYIEMLDSLKEVEGFADFKIFVGKRLKNHLHDIKAEIKALFEMHHSGYLKQICSQEDREPEAILKIIQGEYTYQGILEVAFVNYRFDTSYDTNKLINKESTKLKAGDEFHDEKHNIHIYKQDNGTLIFGKNVDLQRKTLRIYKNKRKQHKVKYPDSPSLLKVYYFVIDCPPNKLYNVGIRDYLDRYLKPGEIFFNCGIAINNTGEFMQSTQLVVRGLELDFEIQNPYFAAFGSPNS
jgi:hypothetical protein